MSDFQIHPGGAVQYYSTKDGGLRSWITEEEVGTVVGEEGKGVGGVG